MFRTALILMTSILDSFILSQDKLLPASASPVLELKARHHLAKLSILDITII